MNGAEEFERNGPAASPHPRAVGAPLSVGGRRPARQVAASFAQAPPPGRSLPTPLPEVASGEPATGAQRVVNMLRQALPLVQRILPLLDGHIATTVSNIVVPHPQAPPPPPPVDLAPIEDGLTELQVRHRELRDQVTEQNTSLRRVEDQLDMVREATDRNTLEQQELMEDLKTVGNKVNLLAMVAFGLLAISILLNVVLYLHVQRVLP